VEKFAVLRRCWFHSGSRCINYSTLSKKLGHLDYELIKQFFALMVGKNNRVTHRTMKIPNQLLLVDSTTITAGETRLS
jgi:hypothetical protein